MLEEVITIRVTRKDIKTIIEILNGDTDDLHKLKYVINLFVDNRVIKDDKS